VRIGAAGTFRYGVPVYGDAATLARFFGVGLILARRDFEAGALSRASHRVRRIFNQSPDKFFWSG
jgi:hypothetical protein